MVDCVSQHTVCIQEVLPILLNAKKVLVWILANIPPRWYASWKAFWEITKITCCSRGRQDQKHTVHHKQPFVLSTQADERKLW